MTSTYFVISCEHGGNRIPPVYRPFFAGFAPLLHSHRGYDMGALKVARELASMLDAPLFASTTSRLLVDLNRSIGHPQLYSEATRNAPDAIRQEILQRYYLPYRTEVESSIAETLRQGNRVIHLSSHSFTPELNGEVRNADIGFLYDPTRHPELEFCNRWRASLRTWAPTLRVRRNYPYRGTADGFAGHLRRRFPADLYTGIELEINQKHVFARAPHWPALRRLLLETLQDVVSSNKFVSPGKSRYSNKGTMAVP